MTSHRSSITSLSSSPCSSDVIATDYVIINIADHNCDYDYDCDNNVFFIDSCYNNDHDKVNDDDDNGNDSSNSNSNSNSKNKKTIKYLINCCCCWYKFAYKNTTAATIQHEQPSLLLLPILAESSFLRSLRIYNKSDIIEVNNKVTET